MSSQIFRILAFGDSLTEGWYRFGRSFYPYTKKLLELLQENHPAKKFHIHNTGISGECVKGSMESRLPEILSKEPQYDLVIILGGTNDLAECLTSREDPKIFEALVNVHQVAHNTGARTVAVSIPEAGFDEYPFAAHIKAERDSINNKLKKFAEKESNKVIFCDLNKLMPMLSIDVWERARLWDDDLHFTPAGYDKMALHIYQCISHLF